MEFLDTTVYKKKTKNKLLTAVYFKATDLKNFLRHKSAHPKSLIENTPCGQALRLKKISAETL